MAASHDDLRRQVLLVDSSANYLLGLPLLLAPRVSATALGLPQESSSFYQRVLGGVLTGVATALLVESKRETEDGLVGLGRTGAIAINVFGAGSVAAWLATSDAEALPRRGRALLWGISAGVLGLAAVETWAEANGRAS
jgi:hypothetical protein